MNLTQEWIQNKAANPAVFSRAQSFYKNRAKIEYYITYLASEQVEITAEVTEGEDVYQVQIEVDQKSQSSVENCNCGGFHTKFGACKHAIATLLKVYDDQRRNQLIVQTDDQDELDIMQQMLNSYEAKLLGALQATVDELIELLPKLVLGEEHIQLEVSIGSNRTYVVRDINKFAYDILHENWVSYGKELQFKHSLEMFSPDSKKLVDLICTTVQEYEIYSGSNMVSKVTRHIELTPNKLEAFFELYVNQTIDCDKPKRLTLVDSNPPIEFTFLKTEDTYELVTNLEHFKLLQGQSHLFFLSQDNLYRCSQAFKESLQPLLESLMLTPQFKLPIPEAKLGKFLSFMMPKMKVFTPELTSGVLLEQFNKVPLTTKFYLDAPQKKIMLEIEFCYGENSFFVNQIDAYSQFPNLLRDIEQEMEILKVVAQFHFLKTESGPYELEDNEHIYQFIQEGVESLNQLGEVYASDKVKSFKVNEPKSFSMGVRLQNNWIHLSFDELQFDAKEYLQILEAYEQRKNYFRLKDGSFLNLEGSAIQNFAHLIEDLGVTKDDIEDEGISVSGYRALYLEQFSKLNPEINLKPHTSFENMVQAFKEVDEANYEVPPSLQQILRPYQETGYRWLKTLTHYHFGGILADEMGLGKTLQVITLILSGWETSEKPSLIITPSSLMYNWKREIEKFAPNLKALVVRGEPGHRELLIEKSSEYDVIITSYDLIRRDIEHYETQTFYYCILDEAHYIKNHSTKNARAVKRLKSHVRFALTGTPIENSIADLWSIFDFILPGYLGSYGHFKKKYETPIVKNQEHRLLERIHQQVSPFILRRLKTDVLKELPPKIETNLYCEMEAEQENLYIATLYQMRQSLGAEIKENGFQQNRIQVLTHLMRLRQLCCHPALYLENYEGESAKFKLCLQLIEDCMASKHKVLLFSQFTSMLDLLAATLTKMGIPYFMLTGSTPSEKRLELAEQFNLDETPIFLISLKAGGTGLNLTGADVVIHYDPWWNLSAQNQATDRAHRIGQDKSVQVFKLLTKQTIEEKIEELQQRKRDLTEAVIKEGETFINGLSEQEMMALFEQEETI